MKYYKIQNRCQKNSHSCVPLTPLGMHCINVYFVVFHLWRYSRIKCHLIHQQTYNVTSTESFPRLTDVSECPELQLCQKWRVSESSYIRGLHIYRETLIKLASKNVHSTVRKLSSPIHSPPLPLSVSWSLRAIALDLALLSTFLCC